MIVFSCVTTGIVPIENTKDGLMSWAPGESVQVCIMLFNDHEQSSACHRVYGAAASLPLFLGYWAAS